MGLPTAALPFGSRLTDGTAGRWTGRNAQWSRGSVSGFSSAVPFAPCSIHAFSSAICCEVRGLPSGGIRLDSSASVTRSSSRLPASPGATAGPEVPPAVIRRTVRPAYGR